MTQPVKDTAYQPTSEWSGDLRVVSFSHLDDPVEDFLAVPQQVEGLDDDQASAERAGTQAIIDDRNTYYRNAASRNFLAYRNERPVARITAFRNRLLLEKGRPIGLVGLFAAEDDPEAVQALMGDAADWLRAQGLQAVRGPMAGDIWHRWRFMTTGFDTAPFPGEPRQPAHYPELFEASGFTPVRTYCTKRIDDLPAQLERFSTAVGLISKRGYSFRSFDQADWDGELKRLCELCGHSFATNWCVTPTTEEEFCDIYGRWLRRVGPNSILLALDKKDAVVGLGLAVSAPENTLNIRTIAILPDQHGYGLGQAITAELYRRAIAAGQTTVHHCLMGPLTPPQWWDHGHGVVTREYTMYQWSIG
jgi:ribosomal protein S18 acetylase RimI-like enzyme